VGAYRRLALLRTVIVNLKDGTGIHGVLFKELGPLLVLQNASLLEAGRDPVPLDGQIIIERTEVRFIQAP
jgi:small nuclear ribonucleoprotein (snRNP)-like protein